MAVVAAHLYERDLAEAEQYILAVEFRSRDGRSWGAVGGGPTAAAAIDSGD